MLFRAAGRRRFGTTIPETKVKISALHIGSVIDDADG
jgi:hypothetical protein